MVSGERYLWDSATANSSVKRTTRNTYLFSCVFKKRHAESANFVATPRASPTLPEGKTIGLLVRPEEMIVGRVRHQDLLTDIGGGGAAGSWSGSTLSV